MTPLDVLTAARLLIIKKGWTTNAFARDPRGRTVSVDDPGASCFCAAGALIATSGPHLKSYQTALSHLRNAVGGGGVGRFNDAPGRTKEEVLAAFDKAIKFAKAEGR